MDDLLGYRFFTKEETMAMLDQVKKDYEILRPYKLKEYRGEKLDITSLVSMQKYNYSETLGSILVGTFEVSSDWITCEQLKRPMTDEMRLLYISQLNKVLNDKFCPQYIKNIVNNAINRLNDKKAFAYDFLGGLLGLVSLQDKM